MLKLFILFILLISLVLLCVCDSAITPSERVEGYYLSGAIVKDLDLDRLSIKVTLNRDDTVLSDAILYIGNDTLIYNSGYYFKIFESVSDLSVGNHYLTLVDSNLFTDSVMFSIASDFEITNKIPVDTFPYRAGDLARVEWSIPTNVNRYAYAVTKINDIYASGGFSRFVESGAAAEIIEVDAFSLPSGEIDTGWYYVYVYGFKDSPVTSDNIPTMFPAGLTNNISKHDFSAKFGSVIVTRRDSIHAVIVDFF